MINDSIAGVVYVQFSIGSTPSIGLLTMKSLVGIVDFHVVKADTPFLLFGPIRFDYLISLSEHVGGDIRNPT